MTVLGIDVSKWNGEWDAAKAKAAGLAFVFIKSSQATFTDPRFTINWKKAKDVDLLRGAYHYLDYTKPAKDQAKYFAELLSSSPGELPLVVDYEQRHINTNAAAALAYLHDFIEQLKSRGLTPIIYTSPAFWREYGDTNSYWTQFPLWLAHYTTAAAPIVPAPWQRWTFWQYTTKGIGPTYGTESYNVDMNHFNGSLEDLLAFAGIRAPISDLEKRVAEVEQYITAFKKSAITFTQHITALDKRITAIEKYLAGFAQPPSPVHESEPEMYAVCTANALNVRNGPGTSYPVIGSLERDQRAKVLERQNGWARIDTPAGWSNERYLNYV